jgi:hypothetical protein
MAGNRVDRLVLPISALAASVMLAVLSGSIAHDGFGIPRHIIRANALASAISICIAVACGALLRRRS